MKMTSMPQIFHKIFVLLSLLAATLAHAQLTVEITGAGANRIPVAIANFAGDPAATGEYAVPEIQTLIASGKPIFDITQIGRAHVCTPVTL